MYITTCFSYDEVTLVLSQVKDSISVQLRSDKNINISVTLHAMQCKIFGEALIKAAGQMQVSQMGDELAGSLQVDFNLQNEQEDVPCQLQDLFAPTDKKSLSRSA